MTDASMIDRPKLLADAAARLSRSEQLGQPHVAPLTAFVAELRAERGISANIPDFDPWDGGTEAELLFLLEAPGARAVASGFVSRNNPDETAKNFFELNREAGIPRRRTVMWNVVPWYIGTGTKIRPAKPVDVGASEFALRRLLALLPRLRAVVLVGRAAENAMATIQDTCPQARVFVSPHPSPLFVNRKPGNRDRLLSVLRRSSRAS